MQIRNNYSLYKYLLIEIDYVTVLLDCIMCVKIVSFFLNN